MEKIGKIKTYVNFSIKNGSCLFGVDNIIKCKSCKIIFYEKSLAYNSLSKLKSKFANDMIINLDDLFSDFADRNIKVLAIKDENLANACKEILSQSGLFGGITVE